MSEPTDNRREHARAVAGWLAANWVLLAACAVMGTVAAVTGTISYGHIFWLTLALGGSRLVGHLMPFGVDGQIVMGSIMLLAARGRQRHWGWLGIVPGLAESVFANYMSGLPHGHLAAAWYTVAAEGFAVASFLFERLLKSLVGQGGRTGRDGRAEQEAEPGTEPAAAPEPVIAEVPVEVPVSCGHEHPGTVDEAIVSAYLHARDCEGEPVSQRKLSERFGQSRARVAELVRPHASEAERRAAGFDLKRDGEASPEPEAASA